jgi:carboxypeptidase D
LSYLDERNMKCKYAGYLKKHLNYPPKGLLPLPGKSVDADPGCDLWTEIFEAALLINPAFNVYRIFDMVSTVLSSILPCRLWLICS